MIDYIGPFVSLCVFALIVYLMVRWAFYINDE